MKSTLAFLSTVVALSGCGQTGPLYMPKPPVKPAAAKPAPVEPAQPAPSVPSNNASVPAPHR